MIGWNPEQWDWSDENTYNEAQNIVERLAKAKWITGRAMVSPQGVFLQFTDLGNRQLGKLGKYLQPFERQCLEGGPKKPLLWQRMKLQLAICVHGAMVVRPLPTEMQWCVLFWILLTESRKLRQSGM